MAHQLPEFPGVARYPVDAWEAVGSPMLTTKGWINMWKIIAQNSMADLHTVFEAARKLDPSTVSDVRCTPSLPSWSSVPSTPSESWHQLYGVGASGSQREIAGEDH